MSVQQATKNDGLFHLWNCRIIFALTAYAAFL
jgi:hypothetical protein